MIVSIGVVGAGNFAQFASEALLRTGKVKMVAFMDVDMKAASKMAKKNSRQLVMMCLKIS